MRDRSAPLTDPETAALDWEKSGGLIPAIVQDPKSGRVLMLGYMNRDALLATLRSGLATFFSRARNELWEKGETSGNRLRVRAIFEDCDSDTLLVLADPEGPTCHLGTPSCFGAPTPGPGWLAELSAIVSERATSGDAKSYTRRLLDEGPARIGQKVGEEGVEVAIAAVSRDTGACTEEVADLVYHLSVLMEARGFNWEDVVAVLRERHASASK